MLERPEIAPSGCFAVGPDPELFSTDSAIVTVACVLPVVVAWVLSNVGSVWPIEPAPLAISLYDTFTLALRFGLGH
jgi:hypothetical protein